MTPFSGLRKIPFLSGVVLALTVTTVSRCSFPTAGTPAASPPPCFVRTTGSPTPTPCPPTPYARKPLSLIASSLPFPG
jgi:hypothetical protein